MINGIEGIPGSGKSYEAVVYHVLHYLRSGRLVITNLPLNVEKFAAIDPAFAALIEIRDKSQKVLGTWDADRTPAFVADVTPKDAEWDPQYSVQSADLQTGFSTRSKKTRSALFGSVWDFYSDWRSLDGLGPVFIIDECHVGMPKIGTSAEVIEWYKLHRHFNVDVLLMTQSFRDVCPEIAGLLAMLIKVRKADILGKKDCYIRKVQSGYRGATISTDERKYQPQFFPLYKSHTQGSSLAEASAPDVKPMIVKFNRAKWVVFGVGACVLMWVGWDFTHPPKKAQKVVTITHTGPVLAPGAINPVQQASAPRLASSAPIADGEMPEPYETKSIHMTGIATMGKKTIYTFAIAQNGMVVNSVTDSDLVRSGYKWQPTTGCTGALLWHDKARAVSCDAPQVSMAMAGKSADPQSH